MKIIARGWEWEKSDENSAWLAYKCHGCGQLCTYPTPRRFGLRCSSCKTEVLPYCYVRKVKQVKG